MHNNSHTVKHSGKRKQSKESNKPSLLIRLFADHHFINSVRLSHFTEQQPDNTQLHLVTSLTELIM